MKRTDGERYVAGERLSVRTEKVDAQLFAGVNYLKHAFAGRHLRMDMTDQDLSRQCRRYLIQSRNEEVQIIQRPAHGRFATPGPVQFQRVSPCQIKITQAEPG